MKNRPLAVSISNLVRNAWLVGPYDATKTGVAEDVAKEYLSAEQVGDELGWGFPLHRGAIEFFKYGRGVSLWVTPQADDAGAVAASGTITVTVTTVVAGTLFLYVADELVEVGLTAAMTDAQVATAIADAINADRDLPVTATVALGVVTCTSKAKGTYGNGITLADSLDVGQTVPGGVTLAYVAMSLGATDPDLTDALAGLGSGDASNTPGITGAAHAYDQTSANHTKCLDYIGKTDEAIGCWAPTVGKPFRFLGFDTTPGSAGYDALKVISDAQTLNRGVCVAGAPDSYRHPFDLACEALGYAESVNQANPHRSYVGAPLSGHNGTDRWTDEGATRDAAIKAGIATTRVINGVLVLDGLVTMSRPASIPVNNNAYRSFRNISIAQNTLNSHNEYWAAYPSWTQVKDVSLVDPAEKPYVLDTDAVEDLNADMATKWEGKAWLYEAAHTIENQTVTEREASNGFDITLPLVFSGEGVVSDTVMYADISLAVVSG
jgi:hypothetical protein